MCTLGRLARSGVSHVGGIKNHARARARNVLGSSSFCLRQRYAMHVHGVERIGAWRTPGHRNYGTSTPVARLRGLPNATE
eukprot:3348016-Pyramimonas_sp.AAC.1